MDSNKLKLRLDDISEVNPALTCYHRDLHAHNRRQRQMCIRDSIHSSNMEYKRSYLRHQNKLVQLFLPAASKFAP